MVGPRGLAEATLGGRPKRSANEEATQLRSGQPNPTDPGDAADLSFPQGYL